MPGLAGYEIPTEDVPLPKAKLSDEMRAKLDAGEITAEQAEASRKRTLVVRGLALQDITYLVQNHLADILKATTVFITKRKGGAINNTLLSELVVVLAQDFPTLVTEIVSIAADEPDEKTVVSRLPFLITVSALLAILRCTSEEAGGLKNLLAHVAPVLGDAVRPGIVTPGTLAHKLLASIMDYGGTRTSSTDTDTIA